MIKDFQLKMIALGIVESEGVRDGIEDNIFYDAERTRLASNADLTRRVVQIAETMGRAPYSDREARSVLGWKTTNETDIGR